MRIRKANTVREHLKRKHYPVQCDRCYTIFPGTDRAVCVRDLQAHRQQLKICERRNDNLKEGISEAQWAQLDKKKSAKQSKTSSRVEKYWEIWDILFPNIPRPKTPCKLFSRGHINTVGLMDPRVRRQRK